MFGLFINTVQSNETHCVNLKTRLYELCAGVDCVHTVCACIPSASAQNLLCGNSLSFPEWHPVKTHAMLSLFNNPNNNNKQQYL